MANAKYVFILTVIVMTVAQPLDNKYCHLESCAEQGIHTLCKFSSEETGSDCGLVHSQSMTDDQIHQVLSIHNYLRNKVAIGNETYELYNRTLPAAKTMNELEWDDTLAKTAQAWANQCTFKHDECRDTEENLVGQNILRFSYTGDYTMQDLALSVYSWYFEVVNFNRETIERYTPGNRTISHFTQMIWAKTTHVGCGLTNYEINNWNISLIVCNYSPAGNIIGEPVYEPLE